MYLIHVSYDQLLHLLAAIQSINVHDLKKIREFVYVQESNSFVLPQEYRHEEEM